MRCGGGWDEAKQARRRGQSELRKGGGEGRPKEGKGGKGALVGSRAL